MLFCIPYYLRPTTPLCNNLRLNNHAQFLGISGSYGYSG